MAQAPKTVAGVVTSADDGEPIIGASVLVEGTTMGAIKMCIRDRVIVDLTNKLFCHLKNKVL